MLSKKTSTTFVQLKIALELTTFTSFRQQHTYILFSNGKQCKMENSLYRRRYIFISFREFFPFLSLILHFFSLVGFLGIQEKTRSLMYRVQTQYSKLNHAITSRSNGNYVQMISLQLLILSTLNWFRCSFMGCTEFFCCYCCCCYCTAATFTSIKWFI